MNQKNQCTLSVDLEDWFHLTGAGLDYQFHPEFSKSVDWDKFQQRIGVSTDWILNTLHANKTKATFFILGWVADRHPELVNRISKEGHEIASHGFSHKVLSKLSPEEFRADVRRAADAIHKACGIMPEGFRASSASITAWALEILKDEGYLYDSSYYPATYHDVYGKIEGVDDSKPIERYSNGLWLVKFSSLRIRNLFIPWSGGGYFRFLPYGLFKSGVKKIIDNEGLFNFYIHPWEVDPSAPILPGLKYSRIRRRIGTKYTKSRFMKLLSDFKFVPIKETLSTYISEDE